MVTLGTTIELGRRLVPAPSLQEPPEGFVVAALRAINLRRREGIELGLLVPHHLDLRGVGELLFGRLLHRLCRGLAGVPTVVAHIGDCYLSGALYLFELEARATLRAEL